MKKTCTQLIILVMIAFILLPVSATGQNTTNSTVVQTNTTTTVESPVINQTPTETTVIIPVNTTKTVPPATTTPVPVTTTETAAGTTATTPASTTSPVTQVTVGNITVASSPMGASILIDGVYYGITPLDLTGIPAGNHMVRLVLSGYYDYEGTIYVLPGEVSNVFGTLPPVTGYYTQLSTAPVTPVSTTATVPAETVQPSQTSSPGPSGPLENPTVLAAVIGGLITAAIGASATIFTHVWKPKKE
jgi:hypothetical protein